jgi:hypothetical protein
MTTCFERTSTVTGNGVKMRQVKRTASQEDQDQLIDVFDVMGQIATIDGNRALLVARLDAAREALGIPEGSPFEYNKDTRELSWQVREDELKE